MKFSVKLKTLFSAVTAVLVLSAVLNSCDNLMADLEAVAPCARHYYLEKVMTNSSQKYTVMHYYQNLDDDEYTDDVETMYFYGKPGELTTAVAEDRYGFTAQPFEQKTITENTVIEIYYTRNRNTVTYEDNLDNEDKGVPAAQE